MNRTPDTFAALPKSRKKESERWEVAGMNRTPDTFATLPRDEMASLLARAYALGFDRAACDAALGRAKPLQEWCRAEVLLHHDMSQQIFTHVPLRDGRSVAATCKAWAATFWLQESTADAEWVITHEGGILQFRLPSLKSTRKPGLQLDYENLELSDALGPKVERRWCLLCHCNPMCPGMRPHVHGHPAPRNPGRY